MATSVGGRVPVSIKLELGVARDVECESCGSGSGWEVPVIGLVGDGVLELGTIVGCQACTPAEGQD